MNDLIIITRPEWQAHIFSSELEALGFVVFAQPVLEIETLIFDAPDMANYGAVIFTSANAVRVFTQHVDVRGVEAFAVGSRTAAVAKAAGFALVHDAGGDAEDLAILVAETVVRDGKSLLHVRGEDVACSIKSLLADEGINVFELVVYRAKPTERFSREFLDILKDDRGLCVTFFSVRTVENFLRLAEQHDVLGRLKRAKALCISGGVLECVRPALWGQVYVSDTPDRMGMIRALQDHYGYRAEIKILGEDHIDMSKQAIHNAEKVIERFGGIRPMAKKMDVAVTTVQGWKKRNTIPANRRSQITEAAAAHNVDLSGVIEGAAINNPQDAQGHVAVSANENILHNANIGECADGASADVHGEGDARSKGGRESNQEEDQEQGVAVSSAPPKEGKAMPVVTATNTDVVEQASREIAHPREEPAPTHQDLMAKIAQSEDKAVGKALWVTVLLILITVAAVLLLLWPDSKGATQRLAALEEEVELVQETQQSFLSTVIPSDLNERLAALQERAETAKAQADVAMEKAREISNDVLAEDAGTMEERAVKLQAHASEMFGSPRFDALRARFEGMNDSLIGQQKLDASIAELSAIVTQLQGNTAQLNEALNSARQENAALSQTFDQVPTQDLRAAALLLGMTQFRSSLNRDNQPFDGDLQLLQNLVGEDNAELSAALARLAPHAQSGILTPSGLSKELRTITGDVVVSSLKGEDVSFEERARARLNEILQVEKDGELKTGTDTQATLNKADALLEQGDIVGAIMQMRTFEGDQAVIVQPWIKKALGTMDSRNLDKFMNGAALGLVGMTPKGTLIQNEETGINIYTPGRVLGVPGQ